MGVVLDVVAVVVFVVIGRASHVQGESLAGIASTSWPFLCGLAAGWAAAAVLSRARRWAAGNWAAGGRAAGGRAAGVWALAVWPAGVAVWLMTVALGMILRVVAGQGTAVAFIVVALVFLGLFLLGWRLAWALAARARPRRPGKSRRQAEAGTGP